MANARVEAPRRLAGAGDLLRHRAVMIGSTDMLATSSSAADTSMSENRTLVGHDVSQTGGQLPVLADLGRRLRSSRMTNVVSRKEHEDRRPGVIRNVFAQAENEARQHRRRSAVRAALPESEPIDSFAQRPGRAVPGRLARHQDHRSRRCSRRESPLSGAQRHQLIDVMRHAHRSRSRPPCRARRGPASACGRRDRRASPRSATPAPPPETTR